LWGLPQRCETAESSHQKQYKERAERSKHQILEESSLYKSLTCPAAVHHREISFRCSLGLTGGCHPVN
jgi:hypothetical protein